MELWQLCGIEFVRLIINRKNWIPHNCHWLHNNIPNLNTTSIDMDSTIYRNVKRFMYAYFLIGSLFYDCERLIGLHKIIKL